MINAIPNHHTMYQGDVNRLYVDWGNNDPADKTGSLGAGDSVSSCVVAQGTKPGGAADLTFSSVSVPANADEDDIRGRVWDQGEATVCTVTAASNQTEGMYTVEFTATTANGLTLNRPVKIYVRPM